MSELSTRNRRNQGGIRDLWNDPFRQFGNGLSQFFRQAFEGSGSEITLGKYPVDVEEDGNSIIVEAELPGFKKEEIEVNVESGVLTIKAERMPKESVDKQQHLNERRYTRVMRSFNLPSSIDDSDVDATLNDGVLKICLKKSEAAKPRRIEVK
jgi:HSP20 family protein